LLAFGLGLYYLFRVVSEQTRSQALGLIVLLLFVTEYRHVMAWGLAALRAWHWLALLGTLFHALRLVQKPEMRPALNTSLLALYLAIAFGIGYDFMAISVAVSAFAILFN